MPEDKLDMLIRLSAIALVDGKRQKDQVRVLSLAGMSPKEIADLIGTTPNSVNVALTNLRKARRMNLKSEDTEDNG